MLSMKRAASILLVAAAVSAVAAPASAKIKLQGTKLQGTKLQGMTHQETLVKGVKHQGTQYNDLTTQNLDQPGARAAAHGFDAHAVTIDAIVLPEAE
ncbi:MAG: hypothetical protein MI920_03240 [Kiloniellales bacterium]|nr:hypothetical protein [Kiloniellales bacterium]